MLFSKKCQNQQNQTESEKQTPCRMQAAGSTYRLFLFLLTWNQFSCALWALPGARFPPNGPNLQYWAAHHHERAPADREKTNELADQL